jgi:formate-dependent nitrite reductase cytochrome c552 subunit
MGLGASRKSDAASVMSLTERLAKLKSERFDHNTTNFPLTGKHTKVDCAGCHKTTIENNPSTCVACHKKDEPHNGRRPDCAKCHTTNRWTQILRR